MNRWMKFGLVGLVLMVVLLVGSLTAYRLLYGERIYPGVFVQGVDVGGLSPEEAEAILQRQLPSPDERGLTLRAGDQAWRMSWRALGQDYDYAETAKAAYQVGREGTSPRQLLSMVEIELNEVDLAPRLAPPDALKVEAAIQQIAELLRVTPVDAQLILNAEGATAIPGQAGQSLDIESSVDAVMAALAAGQEEATLTPETVSPLLMQPEPAYTDAQALLSQPFLLDADDPLTDYKAEFVAEPARVASWLHPVIEQDDTTARMELRVDKKTVEGWLAEIAPQVGEERQIHIPGTTNRIVEALEAGSHRATARIRHPQSSYTIQPGDTFFDIAYSFGFPQWRLEEANPDIDPGAIDAGQAMVIPSIDVLFPHPLPQDKRIEINLPEQKLRAYESDALLFEFTISSGMSSTPTIAGQFQILMKEEDAYAERWSLDMPYFMGIYKEGPTFYNGIHELPISADGRRLWGGILGWPASYGCIILDIGDAEKLFDWAPIGTLVRIEGVAPGTPFGRDETLEGLVGESAPSAE